MNTIIEAAELRNPYYEITYMIKLIVMVIINSARSVWCV